MGHVLRLKIFAAAVLLAGALPVCADVKSDYDAKWGAREKKATIPGDRAKLANDLMDNVEEIVAGKKRKRDSLDKAEAQIAALRGDRRDEVMLLSQKAYQLGAKQRESYAAAARAL